MTAMRRASHPNDPIESQSASNLLEVTCAWPKKRLNYKLNSNNLYQNNNNHKILRPKRDVSSSGWSNMKSMHYCTWNAPLNKKYFTAYYEENREIHGCTSSEQTPSGVLVHAIHLNTTNRNVLLTIEGKHIIF